MRLLCYCRRSVLVGFLNPTDNLSLKMSLEEHRHPPITTASGQSGVFLGMNPQWASYECYQKKGRKIWRYWPRDADA